MSETVISAEGLSKRYRIGQRESYGTLRDSLARMANPARWVRKGDGAARTDERDFWALRDVSLEVKRGQVLGIIGRNGAGKSTLLKVLSRITRPTTGWAEVRGRVASLLEVGTGFHAELTGRENVFLNGAILGMPKAEITRKFDEIVAFAEVERFIDTPVKHYSSGMYLRLAFAVAAFLEPEILIIDEVLAVGDVEFQKRCLGRMKDASQSGRTVLFVSHNLQAVRALCHEAFVLERGAIKFRGGPDQATREYLAHGPSAPELMARTPLGGSGKVKILSVEVLDQHGQERILCVDRAGSFQIRIIIVTRETVREADVSIAVLSAAGTAAASETVGDELGFLTLAPGQHEFSVAIEARFFKLESYSVSIFVTEKGAVLDRVDALPLPEIEDRTAIDVQEARRWGLLRIPVRWRHRPSGQVSL